MKLVLETVLSIRKNELAFTLKIIVMKQSALIGMQEDVQISFLVQELVIFKENKANQLH
jgi:hypothetical protein